MSLEQLTASLIVLLALSTAADPARAFTFELAAEDFDAEGVEPVFSNVQAFEFAIDLADPLIAGGVYQNVSVVLVQYIVRGSLSTNPPTPSGFPAFRLDRTPSGEGPISPADWIGQGSSIDFEISSSANLNDGLQLSDLVPDVDGLILVVDAREFERLDRARYHPPQLLLFADGTGILQNSNNSSGSTGTTNPATGLTVDVDFGEEYITDLVFDPAQITVAVPEPEPGVLVAVALATVYAVAWASRRSRSLASVRARRVN